MLSFFDFLFYSEQLCFRRHFFLIFLARKIRVFSPACFRFSKGASRTVAPRRATS